MLLTVLVTLLRSRCVDASTWVTGAVMVLGLANETPPPVPMLLTPKFWNRLPPLTEAISLRLSSWSRDRSLIISADMVNLLEFAAVWKGALFVALAATNA